MSGNTGRVYLVGAGPGDPELLTVRATRILAAADVVLVDDLIDAGALKLLRAGARVIDVGKRGNGCRTRGSTPQAFIERLMIREARAGHSVVRLKGGDPFVFGRGAEEVAALRAAGIAVEVVPGITSGIAAPAAIGVPVTDRRYAQGAIFVTGHTQDGGTEPDWAALAATRLTLVIYMGMARCAHIASRLCDGGLTAQTPVAVIQHAHTAQQRAVVTTLAAVAGDIARLGIGSPAIIVVGNVVRAAELATDAQSVLIRAAL
jgi:uroporphyrin-III C-methyltransferase